ncbi:hypothetical protein U1Q18_014066, partial [Sarracenia purpurea var. burkii]
VKESRKSSHALACVLRPTGSYCKAWSQVPRSGSQAYSAGQHPWFQLADLMWPV